MGTPEQNASYYQRNKKRLKAMALSRYYEKRDEILETMRLDYQRDRSKRLAKCKAYYWANREKILAQKKREYTQRKGKR